MIPIRYWNRIANVGDAINPAIIEAVTGTRPYYLFRDDAPHVLGLGSVFFMAGQRSHVWGSGILDPGGDYGRARMEQVHAVRGRLTERLLREKYGLAHPVALGDPGVFVTDLPDFPDIVRSNTIVRRVAVVPHYAMVAHPAFQRLARDGDGDIVSPRLPAHDFLRELLASEIVISQSLHGLIFAEALGKPSVWIAHDLSERWTFKFHDWFSTTFKPPHEPFRLETDAKRIIAEARLVGMNVNRDALRRSFPFFLAHDRTSVREPTVQQTGRPLAIRVTHDARLANTPEFDHTLYCPPGDEPALRRQLDGISRRFDDAVPAFLIFDTELFDSLKVGELRACIQLLSDLPDRHYYGIQNALVDSSGPTANPHENRRPLSAGPWSDALSWSGVVLVRHLRSFSFGAPGVALYRTVD